MRVLTYNIAGHRGLRQPGHLERIAELVLSTGADVVGLQEVVHRYDRAKKPEELLCELTGMHAEFLPAHRHVRYELGNAILCREPIQRARAHELPHPWPERRTLLEVETTTRDGLPITAFCTHLVHLGRAAARIRRTQATAIARRMSACTRPHFLVGDLNASPHASELHPVRRVCIRHEHLRGLRSWPARRPWLLYDHIWPGPGWEVEEIRILDLHVSDHRPVLAQLGWRGGPLPYPAPEALPAAARAEEEAFTEAMLLDP